MNRAWYAEKGGHPIRRSKSLKSPPAVNCAEHHSKRVGNAVEFNIWRSEQVPDIEIIHTNSHDHRYPPHLHDTLEIIWIRSGHCRLICQAGEYEIDAGEAGVVQPNETHSGGGLGTNVEFIAIQLPRRLLQQLSGEYSESDSPGGGSRSFKLLSREKASSLLPIMIRTLCADLPMDKLLYILRSIMCQILDAPSDSARLGRSNVHPAVSKARAIISDGCAEHVTIGRLARRVDLDMRYLIYVFKLAIGITPHQYRIAMRVELARSLIERGVSLCEVAALAGFADQSHLNRHFRRHWGFSPGAFSESVVVHENIGF